MRITARVLAAMLAGCTPALRQSAPFLQTPELCEVARLPLRIEFEPPLAAPGELYYVHECGERRVVPTACTGVDLMLPAGPVVLTLRVGGATHERAARVTAAASTLVWPLGAPPR